MYWLTFCQSHYSPWPSLLLSDCQTNINMMEIVRIPDYQSFYRGPMTIDNWHDFNSPRKREQRLHTVHTEPGSSTSIVS